MFNWSKKSGNKQLPRDETSFICSVRKTLYLKSNVFQLVSNIGRRISFNETKDVCLAQAAMSLCHTPIYTSLDSRK